MYSSLVFLCVANSARSQMAEGPARTLFGGLVREGVLAAAWQRAADRRAGAGRFRATVSR
jgi:protein-tyrosine-phosphatase